MMDVHEGCHFLHWKHVLHIYYTATPWFPNKSMQCFLLNNVLENGHLSWKQSTVRVNVHSCTVSSLNCIKLTFFYRSQETLRLSSSPRLECTEASKADTIK